MKLYKISGSNEYVDWDVLHNQQGYSLEATNSVTWMSAGDSTHEWGESVNTGYLEPIILRFTNSKGFCLGVYGWHTLNEMALEYGLWPDEAEEAEARSSTLGVSKVAVLEYTTSLRPPEIAKMYLVQKELEEGWMDEDTFAERGWEIVPDVPLGELVFVDASTGDVVYSVETLNEMAFAPTGYFTIEDADDVVFVEQSPYPARGSLAKNYTPNVTVADGSGVDTGLPCYSQKLYIPVVVWHDENWNLGTDYFGWGLSDSSGSIYATNNTGSSRIVISIIVAMIDATDAEVVEVKNQSDVHFYAFRWTSGGVPYWYVVDGDEDWTDDLEADGYEEVPSVVLPSVTEITIYSNSSDHYFQSNVTNHTTLITPAYTYDLYLDQACTSPFMYDSSSLYLLGYLSSGTWKKSSVQTVADMPSSTASDISSSISAQVLTSSGKLWLITNYTGTLHDGGYQWSKVCKVCSSNLATVVTVYDSGNNAYNAFKFTASGTDYYYVLDGAQTDWTDDLSSIGYHLPVVLPTVNREAGAVAIYPNHADVNTNDLRVGRVWDWDTSAWVPSTYDVTKTYAAVTWHCENDFNGYYGVEISMLNNSIGITNVLPFVMTKYIESVYATCDSLNVSIVKVYDTNNLEYNAFVYSTNGTNYYYVLDYVQNDWTNDLSTLGYSLTPNITNTLRLAVSLDANNEPEADTFEAAGWYWWSRVPDEATKNLLIAEDLWYNSGYAFGSARYSTGHKTLVLVGVFTDAEGTSLAPGWNKAFELRNNGGVASLYTPSFGYSLAVKTYRVIISS